MLTLCKNRIWIKLAVVLYNNTCGTLQSWNKVQKVFKVRHICQGCNAYYKVWQTECWASRLVLSKCVAYTYYFYQYSTPRCTKFFAVQKIFKAQRMALKGFLFFRKPSEFFIVFKYLDLWKSCSILRSVVNIVRSRLSLALGEFQSSACTKYNEIDLRISIP